MSKLRLQPSLPLKSNIARSIWSSSRSGLKTTGFQNALKITVNRSFSSTKQNSSFKTKNTKQENEETHGNRQESKAESSKQGEVGNGQETGRAKTNNHRITLNAESARAERATPTSLTAKMRKYGTLGVLVHGCWSVGWIGGIYVALRTGMMDLTPIIDYFGMADSINPEASTFATSFVIYKIIQPIRCPAYS